MEMPHIIEILAAAIFFLAILHTFTVAHFQKHSRRFPPGSAWEGFFHLLGEVEVVFGIWASILFVLIAVFQGLSGAIEYTDGLNFTEPLFVFVIMAMAATKPIVTLSKSGIQALSAKIPLPGQVGSYFVCLTLGPLLGSFITEPAAMTVTALILHDQFFVPHRSARFKYFTIAVLFVNVSIGGAMTPYAAPPILMVASKWGWDLAFVFSHFGWRVFVAVILNAALATTLLFKELRSEPVKRTAFSSTGVPVRLMLLHVIFIALVVATAHHAKVFMAIFLLFMGLVAATQQYQGKLKLKESLLVAYFLGGLVFLGNLQRWWLEPLISGLDALPLFLGTTALTAITDNAALTYLGSQVQNTTDLFKYALVEGAIAGGGLTVIANAPNPAGYSILREKFGPGGVSASKLFLSALLPTIIAMFCLWFL